MAMLREKERRKIIGDCTIGGSASGKTDHPVDAQKACNSFHGIRRQQLHAQSEVQDGRTDSNVIRNQTIRESFEQRKAEYERRIRGWLKTESIENAHGKTDMM